MKLVSKQLPSPDQRNNGLLCFIMKQNGRILIALLLIMSYTLWTEPLDTVWSENNGIKCNQSWLPNRAGSNRAFNALRCPQETAFWLARGEERAPSAPLLRLTSEVTSSHQASLPFLSWNCSPTAGFGHEYLKRFCVHLHLKWFSCFYTPIVEFRPTCLLVFVGIIVAVVGDVLNSGAQNKHSKIRTH